jgi:hypothetical protein
MRRLILGLGVAVLATAPANAELLFGLTSDGRIVTIDSAAPGTIANERTISGLGGDTLLGIDLRATDRMLYGLGQSGALYRLGLTGGGYTAVNLGSLTTALTGGNVDIDFNPAADRLRITSNANQSLRVNVDSGPGTVTTITDGSFSYGSGDAPAIVGAAYLNNRPGVTSTRFFVLDAARNQLAVVNPPNAGVLTTPLALSGLTLTPDGPVSFDISGGSGAAFVAFGNSLYGLNLGTGEASLLGGFGSTTITDITALAVPEPATWAMMIAGFGMAGAAIRRRSTLSLPLAKRLNG